MAIMERVTHATDFLHKPSSAQASVRCADCGITAPNSQRATWGFTRRTTGAELICPECVDIALPAIEVGFGY
ncbi:MAG: hypothetical protein NWR60_02780 [Candidatus Nanopelagicales bacterium]|jgi:hypothetical protein|nr:hypothetical protein [Candidatus Nanopelagicales bacterium]MDP4824768.1 hypothetical protein [Candidatus Nanopelagicales bacterium]MDP4888609.1 hypothetical protein [Candidatus Nanopelagicales bacterium]